MPKPKLNRAGFAELRTSPGTQARLREIAGKVAKDLGPGWGSYVVGTTQDRRGRSRGVVASYSNTAKRQAMRNPGDAAATLSNYVPLSEGKRTRRGR